MLGMNRKVWLLNRKKTDGRYNSGNIVGIEKDYPGLGFFTETQYLKGFEVVRYKVAYVDVVTGKGCAEWVHHSEVSTTNWAVAAVSLCIFTYIYTDYYKDQNTKIVNMINNGTDPLEAICAMQDRMGDNPTCVVLASKRGGESNDAASCSAFRCIVADPPWHYGRSWDTGSKKALVQTMKAEPMPYTQMKLDEIKALPVGDLAADQCDLYLWVTQKYLPDSFDVLKAWGFRYCQTLTWCKAPMGTGQGGLYCPTTEFLILGRRGKMPTGKTRQDSTWWQVKRQRKHSQKPEAFLDMIERQSDAPRLELFARRKRLGWKAWGNEIDSDISLQNACD